MAPVLDPTAQASGAAGAGLRSATQCQGNKSDKVDARKLADLLRTGMLRPVYHGENGLRTLRELARSHQTISKDLNRVMNRLKAVYRGWGIACAGTKVYAPRYREEWLNKIPHAGVRRRAQLLYEQLDGLQALRRQLRPELLAESRKHKAAKLLRQIPLHWADSRRPLDRPDANPAPVPEQAATVDLQWPRH
jgi:hypothetical protein